MAPYIPHPMDTSSVALSGSLESLLEKLAENTHEVWASQRIKDGWTLGAERNDERKLHPCLVPYDELPESEKEYDRQTAREVLKAILQLGYEIRPRQLPQ
ncbi:RyR domain-containing protein [Lignipirellula cremea]|uniref:RyR domain protein n=1 Tax=Lignipirellula cremea TaxID=2528010 RepID=A0A518DVH4_9BACT|nr:RyR domain-containing protein [Lignipirellula cremea]QDU95835.1 RyR domain protein [Lignipirellula cremea]